MDKVLIVDDEYLVRLGLSETIDWNSLGYELIGTAQNGAVGLEMARALKPDLIISDVRMPVMDGLDMAKALFDENADLAVIVYSGYKDFEYAHRALDSGVAGFLLKPIENEELVKRVKEVTQRLREKRLGNRMLGQSKKNAPMLRKQLFSDLLHDEGGTLSAEEQLALLDVKIPKTGILLYCRTEGNDLEQFTLDIEKQLFGYENAVEIFKNYSVVLTSATDEAFVREAVTRVLDAAVRKTDSHFNVGLVKTEGNFSKAYLEAEQLSKNLLYSAINAVATKGTGGKEYKKLVRDALAIIEQDYDKKLSIKSVAGRLFTSESHLMHEFKEEIGKTFNDCLTDFRILKAKELLLKGEMRVGEVAYAVGYTDVKYFGQVFKDAVGMTPSEFILMKTR